MNTIILYLLAGIAGFLFHSLIKLKGLSDDSRAANEPFNWVKDYLIKDIFGILASLMAPFIWLIIFGEVAAKYPALENFAITSFFVMGAIGSYVLQLLLGRAKKELRNTVDDKTNELDKLKKD